MNMRLALVVMLCIFQLFSASDALAKNCKKGQPCGGSCISWSKTCRIESYNSTPDNYKHQSPKTYSDKQSINEPQSTNFKNGNSIVSNIINSNTPLYKMPSQGSPIIKQLRKGFTVIINERRNNWVRVTHLSSTGWIESKFLSKQ